MTGTDVTQVEHLQALVREKVWKQLREVARPDSRFHWDFSSFICDFEGSDRCADRVAALRAWRDSELVFVTPDNSTEAVRRIALEHGKPFLMTTYGIRRGFIHIDSSRVPAAERAYAATLDGADVHGRPVTLNDVAAMPRVELLVTGGSAVTLDGLRLGKGHGYFDLEWALLSEIGAVDERSEIVDVVHDCQVVDAVVQPAPHDVRVDWVVTPTRTLRVEGPGHPLGRVLWELVEGTEFEAIPPVVELAARQGRQLQGTGHVIL